MRLVLDIGGTYIKYGIVYNKQIIKQNKVKTPDGKAIISLIQKIYIDMASENNINCLCISSAGQIAKDGSVRYASSNIPNYTGVKLKEELEELLNIPVVVENDVTACLYNYLDENLLYISVGTGIGGAYKINDIFRGSTYSEMEIGYIKICKDKSFEDLCSTKALLNKYTKVTSNEVTGEQLNQRFMQQDSVVLDLLEEYMEDFATGLESLIYVLDPKKIILGGGITEAEIFDIDLLKQKLTNKNDLLTDRNIILEKSKLGNNAALLGIYQKSLEVYPKINKQTNFKLEHLKYNFIVSAQALPEEPLHSSFIMGRMALAATIGGAAAIRANTAKDILEIKKNVSIPIIGIVKKDYVGSKVYITPSIKEVEELIVAGVEVIALDATSRPRVGGQSLENLVKEIKLKYPRQILMADCGTIQDAKNAIALDFDIISSTLVGYTEQSEGDLIEADDFKILKEMCSLTKEANKFFIAEGNIDCVPKVKRSFEIGSDAIVVGSMITRPHLITKRFTANLTNKIYFIDFDKDFTIADYSNENIIFYTKQDSSEVIEYIKDHQLFSNIIIALNGQAIYYRNGLVIKEGLTSYEDAISYLNDNKYISKDCEQIKI